MIMPIVTAISVIAITTCAIATSPDFTSVLLLVTVNPFVTTGYGLFRALDFVQTSVKVYAAMPYGDGIFFHVVEFICGLVSDCLIITYGFHDS